MKYKNKWKAMSDNKAFWEEVLVGRTITAIDFQDKLNSMTLDSGEVVLVSKPEAIAVIGEKDTDEEST